MISGFGLNARSGHGHHDTVSFASNLPVPFNIPSVLYNLLFEDVGIEFDAKQKDMLETLRFSYNSLVKLQASYVQKSQELAQKIVDNPNDMKLKEQKEEMRLDMLQANYQFKDFVVIMSDLLKRNQYQKLLEFSNIPI
jgi:uncharacterized protein YydD (DUF2326 family)